MAYFVALFRSMKRYNHFLPLLFNLNNGIVVLSPSLLAQQLSCLV